MSDEETIRYKFSGHETFPFRYGWLEKGVRGVEAYSDIFSRDDAPVFLGVGKNMVASIRHWCQVAQLVEFAPTDRRNTRRCFQTSEMGRRLLLDEGWDPFLEDDASLWLVHWLLVSNPEIGTSWQLLYSTFHRPDFRKRELVDYVVSFAKKHSLKVSESVVTRDIDCLLRTYAAAANGSKTHPAETFDCPLLELCLVQRSPDGELYRFAIGPKPSLPSAVFAFALHQYFERHREGLETLSIQECLYGAGSPGQAFKLDENSLIEYVEELEDKSGGDLMLDETAGLKQIFRKRSFEPLSCLEDYYRGGNQR